MTRCYAWPLTVRGDELDLHVSTEHATFGVRLFRFGATVCEVAGPDAAYDGVDLPIGRPDEAWGWPKYTIRLDASLRDGIYLAVPGPEASAVQAGPELAVRSDACLFILRRQPSADILVKLPTATYAAYNQIGGASTYAGALWVRDWAAQGYVASLQRPGNGGVGGRVMEGDAPDPYARGSRRQVFAHWDAPFVAWLESTGYQVSYCTDVDLHFEHGLLDGADLAGPGLLLSAGHDEYWSERMRATVLRFVDRGGSMCFFAGDVACFQIEYADAGDRLFCPKRAGGALWHRDDPEDWLTLNSGAFGGGWWDGSRSVEAYQPVVPDHWIFAGVPEGEISGGPQTPVVGYETDGVRLGPARGRGGSGGRTLLAVARLSEGWVTAGYEHANAAMMIRTAKSGGMVFSTGTTDWPLALADPAVGRITANVIDRLRCRPLVIHGPVCPEGEYIGDGELVGSGQEVTWYVEGVAEPRWTVTGGRVSAGRGHITTVSADDDAYLTVTATTTDAEGRQRFGSRTVRVAGAEEYLRRRIVRALDAMAYPDEQGGALVDQNASETQLATGVIPIRLGWVKHHAAILSDLIAELEARWTREGRMADASLRESELNSYKN